MPEPKKISFFAAVLMSINMIVGCGIYLYPQLMAQQAGNLSFLGWTLAALLLLPIALTIARAARIFPGEGGFYNYCTTALGQDAGFIANWAYLLGYMGLVATITSAVRDRLIDPMGLTIVKEYPILFYIAFILLISLLNMISIQLISKIQSVITLLKLLPLVLMLGAICFYWNPSFDYHISSIIKLDRTIPLAIFGFWGFESCCSISHYIRGGSTKAFGVILLGFSISAFLYTMFHLGLLHIMGSATLAAHGVQAFPKYMGFATGAANLFVLILLVDMMLSFINTAYGASLNNITNIHMLAKHKLTFQPKFLAKLNASDMPTNASFIHGALILALIVLVPSTITLTAITNLGVCTAFFLTLTAVFVQHLRKKNYWSLVTTTIAFFSLGVLLYLTWTTKLGADQWARVLYAAPIIIGIPVGYLMYRWVKRNRRNIHGSDFTD